MVSEDFLELEEKLNRSLEYEKKISILNIDENTNQSKKSSMRKKRAVLYI